jgi:hypothetical protein
MPFEKLSKKEFKTESFEFAGATHCGQVIIVDTTGVPKVDHDVLKAETASHPEKEKLVFLPYSHVLKWSVPNDEKQYRIRYKFEDGKSITSDTLYSAEQINQVHFITMANGDSDFLGYISTNLRQVVPETFYFAVILDSVKVTVVEGKPDDKLEPVNPLESLTE